MIFNTVESRGKIKKWLPKKWKCPGLSSWSKDEKEEVDHLGRTYIRLGVVSITLKPSGGILVL